MATIYRDPTFRFCSIPAQKRTQQVFVVAFPGSQKASHGNACLLGSVAVSAFFLTVRRKLVSSFWAVGAPAVSALRLFCGTLCIAVAGTDTHSDQHSMSVTAQCSPHVRTDLHRPTQNTGWQLQTSLATCSRLVITSIVFTSEARRAVAITLTYWNSGADTTSCTMYRSIATPWPTQTRISPVTGFEPTTEVFERRKKDSSWTGQWCNQAAPLPSPVQNQLRTVHICTLAANFVTFRLA